MTPFAEAGVNSTSQPSKTQEGMVTVLGVGQGFAILILPHWTFSDAILCYWERGNADS